MSARRLDVLDGLRGIAVLLVLWYHVWEISWLASPWAAMQFLPETGFVGVHLFFYISGFVIVYPFMKAQLSGAASPTWGHFAYRRAIKILPSYLLSIALVIAIGYAHFGSFAEAARDVLTHLLFIHTWFRDTYGSINGVLWTLAVEVEFYAVFPLLLWCFRRAPFVTFGTMVALGIAYRVWAATFFYHTYFEQLVENLPGYLDIFGCGMISAYIYLRVRDRCENALARTFGTLAGIGGLVLLVLLLQNLWSVRATDQWSAVWQIYNRSWLGVAFVFIAVGSLLGFPLWRRTIGNPVLLFFGAISYNLYLYHQVIARELLALHVPPYAGSVAHQDPRWQVSYTVVASVVTVAQAALFTYAFERPLLRTVPAQWLQLWSRARAARALNRP